MPSDTIPKPISLRAYAKRRGVSHEAVRRAIEAGRLERSVTIHRGRPAIGDPDLADEEWSARTRAPAVAEPVEPDPAPDEDDVDDRGSLDDDLPFYEARRRREVELWRQAKVKREADELDLGKRKGSLVSVDEARGAVVDRFTVVKMKLLGLSARVKQRLPHIATADVGVINGLVIEALEDLADGGS